MRWIRWYYRCLVKQGYYTSEALWCSPLCSTVVLRTLLPMAEAMVAAGLIASVIQLTDFGSRVTYLLKYHIRIQQTSPIHLKTLMLNYLCFWRLQDERIWQQALLGKHAEVISEVVERRYTLVKEAKGLVLFKTLRSLREYGISWRHSNYVPVATQR